MTRVNDSIPVHGGRQAYSAATGRSCGEIIDLSQNLNPFMPPPGSLEGPLQVLAGRTEILKDYPDPYYLRLHRAVASFTGAELDHVVLTNGASEGLLAVCRYLSGSLGIERAVVPVPSFLDYERNLDLCGIDAVFVEPELAGCGSDLAGLAGSCAPRSALVIGNPNNPDGKLYDTPQIVYAVEMLAEKECCLVLDEAFIDMVPGSPSFVPRISSYSNVIIIRSFTKAFSMAGVRLGAVISVQPHAGQLRRSLPTWNINALADLLMPDLLQLTTELEESVAKIDSIKQHLCSVLERSRFIRVYPGSANFVLIELLGGITAREAQVALLEHGFLVRDCSNYRGLTGRHLRFAVPAPAEVGERFVQALSLCGIIEPDLPEFNSALTGKVSAAVSLKEPLRGVARR